ncbi:hypothetical protein B0H34DRAFT_340696 [Crassisporium funariophilum]|nr:hypothetical protein B0H34DRAFT_340696 [Crassisporium funariophilum]
MSNNADDTDPGFSYSGNWQTLTGSTRQWQGTVHSTTQSGASATFRFVGTAARVYFTVPAGSGSSMADISLDGVTRTVSKTSHSDNFYDDLWFDSGLISNTQHTVVVTNRGSDGGTPLQFDRIAFDGTIIAPPSPPPAPVAPTTTRSVVVTRTTTTDIPMRVWDRPLTIRQ